ncbi:MAG: hypothetical protein NXI31_09885 [bacterium]|nr:hypothetical protein [bacterium]
MSAGSPSVDERLAAARAGLASDDPVAVQSIHRELLTFLSADPRVRPLAATAYDRVRRLAGEPQKFGTQIVECEGRCELWPVDPTTTDSERAKWGLPPLAELRARAGE